MPFERRLPGDLDGLDDEDLVAYAVEAREAGELDSMKNALAVIGHRRFGDLVRRALLKIPHPDAEDVAGQALSDAVLAKFEGGSVGEFVSMMHTILARRIADYHGRAERRPDTTSLPEEHQGEDDAPHRRDAGVSDSEIGAVDAQSVVDQLLGDLSDQHRRTVELYVFDDLSGIDAADQVNQEFPDSNPKMSIDNVQKIASRFRKDLRGLLDDD
jgi:DNA-directed RNA polymerase specialized sigma24 family protein